MKFREDWLPFSLFLLVVLFGSYLRLSHLGRDDFEPDELFHVYAAESLAHDQGPRLPSGELYTRGIDVTRLVQLSVKNFGPTEEAVRLPGAILGVLNLLLFAAVLWGFGGGWAAVWGTFLLAVYPEAIGQSRAIRFYTYQLAFGLVALYTGWRAVRRAGERRAPDRRSFLRQWLWVGATLIALLLATRVHLVTLSIVGGWGACVALAAAADVRARGWRGWKRSVPLQLVCGTAAAALALLVIEPETVARILRRSQEVPSWALAAGNSSSLVYARSLFTSFPVLVSLFPLVFLAVASTRPRLSIYLLTWFAVPFLAHSFVFPWKGQRFILLAVPALLAAAALAASMGAGTLRAWLSGRLAAAGWGVRRNETSAVVAVAAVCLFLIATTPALLRGWETASSKADVKWQRMAEILRDHPDLRELPVGTTSTLQALYYLGDVDFVATVDAGSGRMGDADAEAEQSGDVGDFKAGVPILTTPAGIRSRFDRTGAVLIATDFAFVATERIDPALAAVLEREAQDLCRGRCGAGMLYLWRYRPDPPSNVASDSPRPIVDSADARRVVESPAPTRSRKHLRSTGQHD